MLERGEKGPLCSLGCYKRFKDADYLGWGGVKHSCRLAEKRQGRKRGGGKKERDPCAEECRRTENTGRGNLKSLKNSNEDPSKEP